MAEENIVPLDYAVVGFRGNKFNGEIASEIYQLVDEGLIRIIDLVFLSKDKEGQYTALELNDLSDEEYVQFVPLAQHMDPLFTPEDVGTLAAQVPADSAAMIILWQNIWTDKLRRAVANANGELLLQERVPAEVLNEVMAEIKATRAVKSSV